MPKVNSEMDRDPKRSESGNEDRRKVRAYFDIQEEKNPKDKESVAGFIVSTYFHEGDSILLDAGTSLYPLANRIVTASKESPDATHFTIMTHNYRAFEILVGAP